MFVPIWLRAWTLRGAHLGVTNRSRRAARSAQRSRAYRPALEELECRQLLSASIFNLKADFSQALSDAGSAAQLALQSAGEYARGVVTQDPSLLQQASQDWAGAQADVLQLYHQDVQSLRDDLNLEKNVDSAIASSPKDNRMQAGVLELLLGSFARFEGFISNNKELTDKGIELQNKGVDNFFTPMKEQVDELFQMAPNPTASPEPSHHHQSATGQTSLPLIAEGPIVSGYPTFQIFYNENAPGGPPGRA